MIGANILLEDFLINTIVPPTFRTYSVAMTYDIEYDLLLECAGKESEHEVKMNKVVIETMTREGGYLGPPETPPPARASIHVMPSMYGHLRPRDASFWRPKSPPPLYER